MNLFQVVFIPVVVAVILLDIRGLLVGRGHRVTRLSRVSLAIIAIILIAVPDLTNWAASLLGIGRGADLVTYLFMLAAPIAWFQIQTQQFNIQRKLVRLARVEALATATYQTPPDASDEQS